MFNLFVLVLPFKIAVSHPTYKFMHQNIHISTDKTIKRLSLTHSFSRCVLCHFLSPWLHSGITIYQKVGVETLLSCSGTRFHQHILPFNKIYTRSNIDEFYYYEVAWFCPVRGIFSAGQDEAWSCKGFYIFNIWS